MIFALLHDLAAAVAAMPRHHPRRRLFALLDEALRRDAHFIDRHPTALFQCLWNTAWWYDSPAAAGHYDVSDYPADQNLPWEMEGWPVSTLLDEWRRRKEDDTPGFRWLRSLLPPTGQLGTSQKQVLQGHRQKVYCVCFSPDGSRIASGSGDQTVRVWDAATGVEIHRFEHYLCRVNSVAFSPDGRRLAATGQDDDWVTVRDAGSGHHLFSISAGGSAPNRLCYSPDGTWLAVAAGNAVRLYRAAEEGDPDRQFQVPGEVALRVAFSPDGRRLATASRDLTPAARHTIRVFDVSTGDELFRLPAGRGATGAAFSPDGERLVTGGGEVRVWDASNGAELFEVGQDVRATRVCFSPDGRLLAGIAPDQTSVLLWDAETGIEHARLAGHTDVVTGVCFSPDSRRLATSSFDATVRVWDAGRGAGPLTRVGHLGEVHHLRFSPDGRWLASASSDEGAVRVWDAGDGTALACCNIPFSTGWSKFAIDLVFSPDGRRLAVSSFFEQNHAVHLWDADRGSVQVLPHEDPVVGVSFSPLGLWLLTQTRDDLVRVWDVLDGTELLRFPDVRSMSDLVVAPYDRLAALVDGPTARVWYIARRAEVVRLGGHSGPMTGACFSDDGRWLATSADGAVRLWDLATGGELACWDGGDCACFSPDGQQLAVVSENSVRTRSVADGALLATLRHSGSVKSVIFSPDARWLATMCSNRVGRPPGDPTAGEWELRVWDAATGAEIAALLQLHITSWVRFTADGRRLLIPERVCIWKAAPLEMETASPDRREKWSEFVDAWEFSTGTRIRVHTGSPYGDPQPFASGSYELRPAVRGFDVVLEDLATRLPVAALAVPSSEDVHLAASPAGPTWAWSFGRFIHLVTLEGDPVAPNLAPADRRPFEAGNCFLRAMPDVPGYEIFHHAGPTLRLRNEFCQFTQLADGRIAVALGRVSGRRRDAVGHLARFAHRVRAALGRHCDLASALADLNTGSWWLGPDQFATLLVMVLDARRHEVSIGSAGHAACWVNRPDGPVVGLGADDVGLPLNVLGDFVYEVSTIRFPPGAAVVAASNFVLDRTGRAGEKLDGAWLTGLVAAGASSADALGRAIVSRMHDLDPPSPDRFELTALCLVRRGVTA